MDMPDVVKNSVILIFPGGTEAGLEIHQALRHMKDVVLIAAGNSIVSHAYFVCDTYETIPSINEPGCIEELNRLIDRHQVDYIFPSHDDIILFLARNRKVLKADVLCPQTWICETLLHKSKTYDFFNDLLPIPRVYRKGDAAMKFPLFAKRERGEGGQGALRIDTLATYTQYVGNSDYVVCEYLPGQEFTIDCLSNSAEGLLFVGARERRRIRGGMSVNSVPASHDRQRECEQYARVIWNHLRLTGAWYFQMKENREGKLMLLEISPRIAGTMALNRVRGVNFPLLSLYAYQNRPLEILLNEHDVEIDRGYTNRYRHNIHFDTVFLDFDDILYRHGQLILEAVKFLFRCKNENKTIFLITRHDSYHTEPLQAILEKFGLNSVFEGIMHVKPDESKAFFIREYLKKIPRQAIFVDDSFTQRRAVAAECHIPTFDLSMLELLTEGRN